MTSRPHRSRDTLPSQSASTTNTPQQNVSHSSGVPHRKPLSNAALQNVIATGVLLPTAAQGLASTSSLSNDDNISDTNHGLAIQSHGELSPKLADVDLSDGTWPSVSKLDREQRETVLQAASQYRPYPPQSQESSYPPASGQVLHNEREVRGGFISEGDPSSYCCDVSLADSKLATSANSYCHGCRTIFGERCQCWRAQRAHSRGQMAPGHEKLNFAIAKLIHETLTAESPDEEQAIRHLFDNESSLWFGAGFDDEGTAVFRDFGRYASLMSERASAQRKPCFPALVSFVGETGAGKSSLIKLLVSMNAVEDNPKTPVVGTVGHSDTPTSGDVHLYGDPQSFNTSDPILYADCEGLNGGSRDPIGAKYRKRRMSTEARHLQGGSLRRHLRRKHNTSERELTWATSREKSTRKYFVHNLYPRLLYTFSDVIVFVVKNARVIEDVVEQLISWADAVLEASSNQPVLPHAIIVLNASDNTSFDLWDVNLSTEVLLDSIQLIVKTNKTLEKYADSWKYRGVHVDSMRALLMYYYSSVRVVRVPEKTQTSLVYQQVQRLYREITEASRQSLEEKSVVRMKLSSEEMQPYLQSAFDHFSHSLETPFDFVKASYAKSNIPSDFSGNILKLAINVMELWYNRLDGLLIFKHLSFMLASCAMIDAVRRGILGGANGMVLHYIPHFDEALEDFGDRHWPCEHVSRGGRCINVKAGHSKGHQLHDGQIVDTGKYESTFNALSYRRELLDDISFHLQQLLQRLGQSKRELSLPEHEAAMRLHRDHVMQHFYRQLGGAHGFLSHSACLSCLVFPPQHCLPCGHILCAPCVRAFGTTLGPTAFALTECPLHDDVQFVPAWTIKLQPVSAGTRVLTLDGGGVRGIAELVSLQHIERQLGGSLRIQTFFDLIVGTSTGGIIALGLGERGWTVDECVRKFESLATIVFQKHKMVPWEVIDAYFTATNGGRYKTEPLERTLIEHFGEECLFGGSKDLDYRAAAMRTKVAVTTTSLDGIPHVLANYNRSEGKDECGYEFLRAEKPQSEIKIWEAARATSAAPRIFRAYNHVPTGLSFLDGGIYHNNPIDIAMREVVHLFPENQGRLPDIVLSLGTAYSANKSKRPSAPASAPPRGAVSYYKTLVKIAKDHIQQALDSESKWSNFISLQDRLEQSRFSRVNFALEGPCPKLDEVAAMTKLKNTVDLMLQEPTRQQQIKHIADRLLATSFYFEQARKPTENERGSLTIAGSVRCRFPPRSEEIYALGELFMKRNRDLMRHPTLRRHKLCFMVEEVLREQLAQPIWIPNETVSDMRTKGEFFLEEEEFEIINPLADVDIHLRFGSEPIHAPNNSISGFPRNWEMERTRRFQPSLSLSRKRVPARRNDRPAWSAPPPKEVSTLDTFAKQDLPGLATVVDIEMVSQRLSEPAEQIVFKNNTAKTDLVNNDVSTYGGTPDQHQAGKPSKSWTLFGQRNHSTVANAKTPIASWAVGVPHESEDNKTPYDVSPDSPSPYELPTGIVADRSGLHELPGDTRPPLFPHNKP